MSHNSSWKRIEVHNNDKSITEWDLDAHGRLLCPPDCGRRCFKTCPDGIRRPVSSREPSNRQTPEEKRYWNSPANDDSWGGSLEPVHRYETTAHPPVEVDQYNGVPEVLMEYDEEFPFCMADEPYLDDGLAFGVW